MTRLYLIRHGEAEGNLYRRMQGDYDGGLTARGWQQLDALARRFQGVQLDAIYASDMCRTMHTAAALCRPRGLPLHTDPRLREVMVGRWEDITFGTAWAQDPEEMYRFSKEPHLWQLPGADTWESVATRGVSALMDIVQAHPGETVAVCAHNFLIRAVLCSLFYGLEHPELSGYGTNTSVSCLIWEGGEFSLEYRHDASHLPDALRRPGTQPEVEIRPMAADAVEEYIRYRKDAWHVVYGDMRGFDGSGFWLDARRTMGDDPEAMAVGYLEGRPMGMIQLSPQRDAPKGVGYIPFLYLREAYRHRGLGIQLLGHAVSFYRRLGRSRLQLSVSPDNVPALGFYKKYGFHQVGKHRSKFGHLMLMEKDISPPKPPADIVIDIQR